jgi:hypothetical protein
MATFYGQIMTPQELIKTPDTSSDVIIILSAGAPDGNSAPESSAAKASFYIRDDATDDQSPLYLKVDADSADDDWVAVIVDRDEVARTMENDWTWDADQRVQFRDSAIFIHSSGDGDMTISADAHIYIGDGTNQMDVQPDGEIQLEGTAQVTKTLWFPIDVGGGTANTEIWNGAATINLDADGETWAYGLRVPGDWNAAGDITVFFDVANEIAEDDGDDISFTGQVRGYADGETTGDAGQAVAVALNLTGGDQAINVINRATGTIDYDEATYPIAANDTLVIEMTVNLGDGTECTGPLHVLAWGIQYTANKLGTAT